MPRSIALFLLPYWRLTWSVVALLWVIGMGQPAGAAPLASVGAVVRVGKANPQPVAVLVEQDSLSREAVAPSGSGTNWWCSPGSALLSAPAGCLLARLVAVHRVLPVRPSAVPDVFRLRLLLAALSPNAP